VPGERTKARATEDLARVAGLQPRLLGARLAAAYVGLSCAAFLRSVAEGRYPPPLPDGRRRQWDIRALDEAIDRRSGLRSSSSRNESPDDLSRAIDAA
jgi:predicted DNA-binding transcriptional regulator AlpA